MTDKSWLERDAEGSMSEQTAALQLALAGQLESLLGAPKELNAILLGFWAGKVTAYAVPLAVGKDLKVFVTEKITPDFAQELCAHIRAMPGKKSACAVRASNMMAIVVGSDQPPAGLDLWVIRHVEKRDPDTTM